MKQEHDLSQLAKAIEMSPEDIYGKRMGFALHVFEFNDSKGPPECANFDRKPY